ncbi:hypothetical protein XELAEV_18036482mg [Xenopus laevis]|uniref:VWFD domain-containing protein n=1 Tax=Xenopus laevis TaxID=8355 RepID=A0A974HD12_XENLA|nr:hypothetical protein XELAEV_18036482mg [Xenopus laevis]
MTSSIIFQLLLSLSLLSSLWSSPTPSSSTRSSSCFDRRMRSRSLRQKSRRKSENSVTFGAWAVDPYQRNAPSAHAPKRRSQQEEDGVEEDGVCELRGLDLRRRHGNYSEPNSNLNITITAFRNKTLVTVTMKQPRFTLPLLLRASETKMIKLPNGAEMVGSGVFNSTVVITSNQDISVTAMNSKSLSSSRIIVHPAEDLGTEYYVVIPSEGTFNNLKEFAVIGYQWPTSVKIFLKGWVMYQGKNYSLAQPLSVELKPGQVFQLQSNNNLSGTRIISTRPVAVLSGDSCTWNKKQCNHVYEQLYPVTSWGKKYVVSPLPFQSGSDIVYVTAWQTTRVNYTSGSLQKRLMVQAGQVVKIPIRTTNPVVLSANVSVQVMFYCTGGVTQGIVFDPFFITIPDVTSYCTSYQVIGLQGYINAVVVTAQTSSLAGLKFNERSLTILKWKTIPGTKYSWAQYRFGRQFKSHLVSHPKMPFVVMSVGLSPKTGYGLTGVCLKQKLFDRWIKILGIERFGGSNSSIERFFIHQTICSKSFDFDIRSRRIYIRQSNIEGSNTCNNIKCRKKETCQIIDGKATCIPDGEALCGIWGGPHYITFDGQNYDFQGTCTYVVAKTCSRAGGGDSTLPEFSIIIKNDNHGSSQASCIAMVFVQILGYNITMVQSEVGYVWVNNVRWPIPISLEEGISITLIGFHALLEADFIRIRYDWNTFLIIKIPSSYTDNVCGLCGNYNDNSNDDFETPEGTRVSSAVELGRSWKVSGNDGFCREDCNGTCYPVPLAAGSIYNGVTSCGILSQKEGPFRLCHTLIDPLVFLNNCIHDMVIHGGYGRTLCQSVNAYAVACQMFGIKFEKWRTALACEIICPQHSQYNSCGSACPATCMGKPSNCPRPCVETCECHPGFVFSEGKCIPKARCGCVFRGRQYPPNKAFWADNNCKRKCMCNVALQKVLCEDSGCRPGEKCSIKDGVLDCYPISYSYCSVFGDPHYRTFDGAHYDFQGTCRYQLTGLCDLNSGLTEFQVHVVNRNRGVQSASYTRAVWLRVYGTEIMLNRENPGRVLGWNAVILTKFGMKINFDWFGEVTVTLPQSYAGAVCGLCGNFNDDPQDDMVMKNNQSAPSILAFGLSWRTREMLSGCREQEPDNCTSLIQLENSQRKSFHNCGILINKTGPFQHCHAIINPETYFKDCIYDSCFYKERQDIFCQVIETYSGTCQDAGVTLLNWRNETFCTNGHYDLCSNGCPMTCSSLSAPRGCKKFCKEGCVCDDGFILDVDVCVPISQCGCVFNGLYYKVNDTFYPSNNCLQQCVCHPGGNVVCTPFACGPNEACRLLNGIRKCHPTGSAWCSVVGGPHFHTFDGLTYDFQGNCSYTLSKSCGKDPLPVFSIRVKIEKSGNKMAFITKSLVVDVADIQFVMMQGKPGMVQVNSNVFNLPLNLGNRGIWVFQHGLKVGLRTAFGLQVTYDLNHEVLLYISSSYYGQVCGLCGNYNGNSKDEFQLPDGSLASEVTTFGSAWQEKLPGTICNSGCGSPGNPCPACPQQSLYEKEAFCGVLLTEGGPFTPCRDRVDPTVYISNCVSDLCRAGGNISALCYSIQSYVSVCQNAGITDIQWRTKDFCPLKCNLNSHYEACADTCANSCSRFTSPVLCPNECSEGCECNENYYLNGATCVLMEKCGCNIEGRYYKIAEIFLNDHCTKICTCQANGSVTCQNYSCKKNCILETDRSIRCSDVKGVSVK